MSDEIFLPLSKTLFGHTRALGKSKLSYELLAIMNTELRSTLTMHSLVNL